MKRTIEYRYIIAVIYTITLFLDRLDLTIVNVALPAIAQHFHVLVTDTEWVNTAFLLALSLSIPMSAWLGERFGHKRIFVGAVSLFTLTCSCCAFAPSLNVLIVARFMQGLASGLFVPVGMSMVFRSFQPKEYTSIVSYMFIPTLMAPALAPMLGGVMVAYFNWRWVFLFAVPIGTLIVISSCCLMKALPSLHLKRIPFDTYGFILSSLVLFLIFHVLACVGNQGITLKISIEFIIAIGLGFWFVRHELHHDHPLLELSLFRSTLFTQANWIQICFQISHFGSLFLIAIYLQMGVGYSAMLSGVTMGMQALGAMCSSRLSVLLSDKYSGSMPICLGLVGVSVMSLLILSIHASRGIAYGLVILFVRGVFSGLCGAPIQALSVIGFSQDKMSQATAIFNISRQLAISLGIALSALLLRMALNHYELSAVAWQNKTTFYPAFSLIACCTLLGAYIAFGMKKSADLN